MTFNLSLSILHENIGGYLELFNSIITAIYCLTALVSYAYSPPGAHSAAVIFQSVITPADETKNNDPNLGKTFDSKVQSKES